LHLIFVDSWDQNKPSSDKNFWVSCTAR
jgi:hypothetical protein